MEEQTKSAILVITSEHVDLLLHHWSHMFDKDYCHELMSKLEERVQSFYVDLLTESKEKEQVIKDDISALQAEASDLMRLLHKNVDIGEMPMGMPLVVWDQKLDHSIEHLREELRVHRAEICELLLQQEMLCEELGELPLPLLADPLPKPEEKAAFCKHLDHLRALRTRRMEELFQLRSKIKEDMKLLEIRVHTAAEEHLLSQANQSLTPDVFAKLRSMQKLFAEQMAELREAIDNTREKIHVLWERLPESDEFAMRRVCEAKEYTQRTYDVLREELHRCQELRRKNMKCLIDQLREEIQKWWELTLKSHQERKRFANFYNDCYNEDLLELHELELDDLKSFYNSNREIFELFSSRAEIWARMEALEAKTNDPNRYNNRGGQLLKEERERKAISSKLPKIEQQITELVKAYELRTQTPFLVHGEDILERMANDWERLRLVKEQSSARKNTVTTPSTRGKMLPPAAPGSTTARTPMSLKKMSTMSSSTMSLRKTPSNWKLASLTGSAAKTTGNLHKRKFPDSSSSAKALTPNAKRSLMKTFKASQELRKSYRSPVVIQQKVIKPQIKKVHLLENTLRRSSGLGRRSHGAPSKKVRARLPVHGFRVQTSASDESDATYDSFEKSIEPAARSSVLPQTKKAF
ncbi:protein regulator of cytokinesis 1 [Drosophila grimshawi]|uniref:GH24191 n=1 Tax=Drosophila grimshawi TaxID=7222 RepID=B4JN77_DROGR|nr:protein regulator of cytokinesis 1 [Drosophila grimshawi]EDV92170.1 GH24191 [Drosophila grimshawi]